MGVVADFTSCAEEASARLGGDDDGFCGGLFTVSTVPCPGERPNGAKQRNDAGFRVAGFTSLLVLDLVARDPGALKGGRMRPIPNGRPTTPFVQKRD